MPVLCSTPQKHRKCSVRQDKTVLPNKMNSLRLQLAIIIVLWVLAEGWLAFYWWPTEHFSRELFSYGIPITAVAIVMMAWTLLRPYAIRLAGKSSQGKVIGIALLLTALVLGGFVPLLIGRIFEDSESFGSLFHGCAGWPLLIGSLFLWILGTMFFLVCLVEILMKKNTKQIHAHDSTVPIGSQHYSKPEQDTGQPATRSELNLQGSDKPQPDAEGRSR